MIARRRGSVARRARRRGAGRRGRAPAAPAPLNAHALQRVTVDRMADTISFARGAPSLDIVDVEGLRAAAAARLRRTTPAAPPPTARGRLRAAARVDRRASTASTLEQVLVTNGSMQADAFLFELLVQPGDAVVVETPTYDRTLLNLRNRGADVHMVDARDRRHRRRRARARCSRRRAARSSRTSSPTSRTRPATRCRSRSARELLALAAEYDFPIFEDDPYIDDPLRGRVAADDALAWTTRARSSTRRRSPRPSARASASATSSARRR